MILARGLLAELPEPPKPCPETVLVRRRPGPVGRRRLRCAFEGPFVSEGWRLVHLHVETIQRRVLFGDALMKILALKVSEVRRQQPAIALDIPLMAQDFFGSHIDRHRRRHFSEGHKDFLSGGGGKGLPRRARYNMRTESQEGELGRRSTRLAPGVRRATVGRCQTSCSSTRASPT